MKRQTIELLKPLSKTGQIPNSLEEVVATITSTYISTPFVSIQEVTSTAGRIQGLEYNTLESLGLDPDVIQTTTETLQTDISQYDIRDNISQDDYPRLIWHILLDPEGYGTRWGIVEEDGITKEVQAQKANETIEDVLCSIYKQNKPELTVEGAIRYIESIADTQTGFINALKSNGGLEVLNKLLTNEQQDEGLSEILENNDAGIEKPLKGMLGRVLNLYREDNALPPQYLDIREELEEIWESNENYHSKVNQSIDLLRDRHLISPEEVELWRSRFTTGIPTQKKASYKLHVPNLGSEVKQRLNRVLDYEAGYLPNGPIERGELKGLSAQRLLPLTPEAPVLRDISPKELENLDQDEKKLYGRMDLDILYSDRMEERLNYWLEQARKNGNQIQIWSPYCPARGYIWDVQGFKPIMVNGSVLTIEDSINHTGETLVHGLIPLLSKLPQDLQIRLVGTLADQEYELGRFPNLTPQDFQNLVNGNLAYLAQRLKRDLGDCSKYQKEEPIHGYRVQYQDNIALIADTMTATAGGVEEWKKLKTQAIERVLKFMEEVSEDKSSKSYQVYQRLYKSRESFYAENVGLREPQEIKDILLEDLIYYTTYHLMVKVAEGSNVILAADSSALHNAASYLADTQKNLIMIYGHYQGA